MSLSEKRMMALSGVGLPDASRGELGSIAKGILSRGIRGLCFSPYTHEQAPGSALTEAQIQSRLEIIKPYTASIRTFSCTDGNEMIPKIARENGLSAMVGIWLGKDKDGNEKEIANAIEIAQAGFADSVAVGNEVMYRGDLSEEELIGYIERVQKELPDVTVGYVDAYYEFCDRPRITEACDVVFANCYPFWEGCRIEYSLLYMKDMYQRACKAAKGKKVVISETGWPSQGSAYGDSVPSASNALRYFLNTQLWAEDEGVEVYYFSSFDEDWKIRDEGDVGAYWGIWDNEGNLKFG